MRMSLASTLISTSSASGSTATVIGGSVHAPLLLGCRHALHAMHAAFVLQLAVDLVAADQRDDFLQAADGRFAGRRDFHLPAAAFRRSASTCGKSRRRTAWPRRRRCRRGFRAPRPSRRADPWAAAEPSAPLRSARAAGSRRATSSCAISRSSGSDSSSIGRPPADSASAVFHSRYLATISVSRCAPWQTLRYWSRVADDGRIRHLRVSSSKRASISSSFC